MRGCLIMRINPLLVHICDLIYTSKDPIDTDPYGRPIYGDVIETNVPCRLDQVMERVVQDETGTDIIISHMMIFNKDQEPTYNMKVVNIRDRNKGNVVIEGSFRVMSIHPSYGMRSLHHYEVDLTRDSSSYENPNQPIYQTEVVTFQGKAREDGDESRKIYFGVSIDDNE